jgi:hypothetical protein
MIRKISRGVHVRVRHLKRGDHACCEVLLSKKRTSELTALKTSPFYQEMTFVDSRDDRIVFRKYLASMEEAISFLGDAMTAANEVGVGSAAEVVLVKETASVQTATK